MSSLRFFLKDGRAVHRPRRNAYVTYLTKELVETFGGFHQDLLDFLYEAKEALDDKLSKEDYDNNTWATTKWFSFAVQQVAVAFHNAVAQESLDAVCSAAAKAVPVSPAW